MYRRLTRLAIFAIVNLGVVLVALAVPGWIGIALVLIASVPIYLAIGPFQADLALNDGLEEHERTRWRIALYLVPWSMALYWHRYVRRY
jgi:hypothetical protein